METGMRGFLLAGKEEFLDPYKGGDKHFPDELNKLKQTVNDNPAQVQLLEEMEEMFICNSLFVYKKHISNSSISSNSS